MIFEELEDYGIIVPEEARYFPYHTTFDFEYYFDKDIGQELKNSEKLNWQSSHVPISVSLRSNVPEHQEQNFLCLTVTPKCLLQNLFST